MVFTHILVDLISLSDYHLVNFNFWLDLSFVCYELSTDFDFIMIFECVIHSYDLSNGYRNNDDDGDQVQHSYLSWPKNRVSFVMMIHMMPQHDPKMIRALLSTITIFLAFD